MIGKSLPAYVGIHIAIGILRLVAPASFLYICASLYLHRFIASPWIAIIAVPEVLFYLLGYLPRRAHLRKPPMQSPERLPKEERERLFANCTQSTSNLPQWFFSTDSADLKRDNVVDWVLWAFFDTKYEDLEKEVLVEWSAEINGYVQVLEQMMGHPFPPGRTKDMKSMRLTIDPVVMLHRPLIWYLIVGLVDLYTACHLFFIGFRHYAPSRWFHEFPTRPWTILSRESVSPQVPYWFRPHRSSTKKPVIFIHGIGIGLYPYIPFLRELDPDLGILLVEILPISFRMTSAPVLPRSVMLEEFYAITSSLKIPEAILVSHSYGTVVAGHIMRSQQLSNSSPLPTRITAYCFIDPIPFLLHFPNVVFNFVYRTPNTANEWLLWYFASRDADVGRTLGRHFFWTENVLFKEELEGETIGVVLSGEDQIVPAKDVWTYFTGKQPTDEMSRWMSDDGALEALYYPRADHATIFERRATRKGVLEVVDRLCRLKTTDTN